MGKSAEHAKWEAIKSELRTVAAESTNRMLPSLRSIAKHYRITVYCASKIVADLCAEGVLKTERRRGTLSAGAQSLPNGFPQRLSAAEAVHRELSARIRTAVYQSGDILPKVSVLCETLRTSERSVCAALQRLVSEGIVSRYGKRFRVGLADATTPMQVTVSSRRYVMIMHQAPDQWRAAALNEWTSPFVRSFMHELSIHAAIPIPAYTHEQQTVTHGLCVGEDSIIRVLRELGENLLGILVMDSEMDYYHLTRRSLTEWFDTLCKFRRPVVWLDPGDAAPKINYQGDFKTHLNAFVAQEHVARVFYRCHFGEPEAVNLALKSLDDLGHSIIGIPQTKRRPIDWRVYRRRLLIDGARRLGIDARTVGVPLIDLHPDTTVGEVIRAIESVSPDFMVPIKDHLAAAAHFATPLHALTQPHRRLVGLIERLGGFLAVPGLTAIVALNDRVGMNYYSFLVAMGMKIPEQLSLISFDDDGSRQFPYLFSSINFGMDNLGYNAFHAMAGDIAVRKDKNCCLFGSCRLNHRASLATPFAKAKGN